MRGWRRPSVGARSGERQPVTFVSQLAQGMASGEFSADFGSDAGINATLDHQGGTGGGAPAFNGPNAGDPQYTLLDWTGKAHFDATADEWWYSAGTTGWWNGSQTMIRYSVRSNNFRHWQGATYDSAGLFGYGQSHNFEAAAFDQSRRKIFRLLNDADNNLKRIGVFDVAAKTGTTWPSAANVNVYSQMEVFPDISALCIFTASNDTTIQRYSMDTGSQLSGWSRTGATYRPALCYYNGRIYFTGDSLGFFALESNGSVSTLPNTPTQMSNNGTDSALDDTHTILCEIGGLIYAFKLSPGASGRGVYRYTPGGSWSANLAGSFPTIRGQKWTVGPVGSVGVALLITSPSTDWASACHIWKP